MESYTYLVEGMTCVHCAAAVTTEVSSLPGVDRVDVDVAAGTVRVTAATEPSATELEAAVSEAGYTLAGRS
ncbi:heavy-metal-associated domain-containing protein [Microbacterium sp. 1P10UB]|uniref:heavy-metal-associated domain-containing protein n=1 Tax=unclassified Microbacterium TaxID=2609290 RepID=UPI0039A0874B